MEIQGKVKMIGETQMFGSNGFRKRELVVTTEEQYPQHIMIEFVQDKCDILSNLQLGQDVKVNINLRGREWVNPEGETKYFNSIQGWKVSNLNGSAVSGHANESAVDKYHEPAPQPPSQDDEHDDLPY